MDDDRRDVSSDPAHDDSTGADWSDEGGALPEGPAEDPQASVADPDDEVSLADSRTPEDR